MQFRCHIKLATSRWTDSLSPISRTFPAHFPNRERYRTIEFPFASGTRPGEEIDSVIPRDAGCNNLFDAPFAVASDFSDAGATLFRN
jgi:hypothetical protein